jgi:hypothetical protein
VDTRTFRPGDIVRHFKRETVDPSSDRYLYMIVGEATHSETREKMMVYAALYGDGGLFVRPLDMFLSEVDHGKYPEIRQKYRFELVERPE